MAILCLAGFSARGRSHTGGVRGLAHHVRSMIVVRVLVCFIGAPVFQSAYSLSPILTDFHTAREHDRHSRSEHVAVTILHPRPPAHVIVSSEIRTALRRLRSCSAPIPEEHGWTMKVRNSTNSAGASVALCIVGSCISLWCRGVQRETRGSVRARRKRW